MLQIPTKIPSPQELGFLEKFQSWRPGQEELIHAILHNKKRAIAACAPTGFGKTGGYVCAAIISDEPTCVVTANRGLQVQLMDDFECVGMVNLMGRRNYTCGMREDMTCEDGYAVRCPFKGTITCPSSQAEMRAATSKLVVTNYAKWTSARRFGQGMDHFTQVIFDEGHEAPDALASAMQVILHYKEIEDTLGVKFPTSVFDFYAWKSWAIVTRGTAEQEVMAARTKVRSTPNPKSSWVRHYVHMKSLVRRLGIISTANPNDWVADQIKDGYQFDPIRPGRYAEAMLLLKIPKIVVVSATLRPKSMFMIGIGQQNFTFHEFDSDFDPRRCPIYWVPTMRVDKNAHDLSMLWARLDQIASRRRDRNGIVHTKSYARRDGVLINSRYSGHMITHDRGELPTEMIDKFRNTYPGAILVDPSVGAGYDFPLRQCEWQFVCKIPFPDGRSKIVKARQQDDKEYGPYMAMQDLVQTCGRGARSKEDQCENFIPDDHLEWFLPRYGHLAPKSFHNFFQKVDILPQPPERL